LSHDLRTPLNGLVLQAHVARLSVESNDADTLRTAVHEIEISARAAAELLNSLLQCARLDWAEDPNQLSSFNLDQILGTVVAGFQSDATRKGIDVAVECPMNLRITSDRTKLERVLANLVGNAVKFTEKGSVRVAVSFAG